MSEQANTTTIAVVAPLGGAADELTRAGLALLRSVEFLRHRIGAEESLGITEMRALSRIGEAGEMTPKALAASLTLSTGAVTAIADRLVEAKLVDRVAHPTDRRSLLLSLSTRGREVTGRASDALRDAVSGAVGEHGDAEILLAAGFLGDAAVRIREAAERFTAQ